MIHLGVNYLGGAECPVFLDTKHLGVNYPGGGECPDFLDTEHLGVNYPGGEECPAFLDTELVYRGVLIKTHYFTPKNNLGRRR